MKLLLSYARAALSLGIIDEWHVWDFARTPEDRQWLTEEFPNLRWIGDKKEHRFLGWAQQDGQGKSRLEFGVRGASNIHIQVASQNPSAPQLLLVLGAEDNTISQLYSLDTNKNPIEATLLASVATPGLLSAQLTKQCVIDYAQGTLKLSINGYSIFSHNIDYGGQLIGAVLCAGNGGPCEIYLPKLADSKQFLFVAENKDAHPYSEFYNYYEQRYSEYKNCVFLKCDDDILYINLIKLRDFIAFRIQNPWYFLVSANVVNNNVCAYYQQQSQLIPYGLMSVDLPPNGFGGKLWEDGGLAETLHNWFLDEPERFIGHNFRQISIEWSQRLSINFIAFLGKDLAEMACRFKDDEHALSIEIPHRLGRTNAIFTPFIVSHLSFYTQNAEMNIGEIINRYEALRDQVIRV